MPLDIAVGGASRLRDAYSYVASLRDGPSETSGKQSSLNASLAKFGQRARPEKAAHSSVCRNGATAGYRSIYQGNETTSGCEKCFHHVEHGLGNRKMFGETLRYGLRPQLCFIRRCTTFSEMKTSCLPSDARIRR